MHTSLRLVLALAALSATAEAQRVLYGFPAQTTHRATAAPVEALGDVDGDGLPDFALGQVVGGGVQVLAGFDGAVIATIPDPGLGALYATSLARVRDLDGDGADDLAVGSTHRLQVGSTCFVELRSSADGKLLARYPGPVDHSFGAAVEAIDDLDGDGFEDLIVSTPENFSAQNAPTSVQAISTADGSNIWTVFRGTLAHFGRDLARVADLDGDGVDEVAASFFAFGTGAHAAQILSGADGSLLREIPGRPSRIARVGDLDGDGFDELAVSALNEEFGNGASGVVRIYRTVDGSLVRELRPLGPFGAFGASLAGGDVDRDGVPDLVVGQSILEAVVFEGSLGAVHAFSGTDGRLLFQTIGDVVNGEFGNAVAILGDATGDGRREIAATGLFGSPFSAFGRVITTRIPSVLPKVRPFVPRSPRR